jgi:hypothetical protein
MGKAHALSRDELIAALTVYSGTATGDGAAGGTTLVDAALIGATDYITGKTVIFIDGACIYETREVTAFAPLTGTLIFDATNGGQVLAGTNYKLLNIPSGLSVAAIAAAVAALQADVGDASASTLGSLYAILGNPATALTTRIGNPDGDTLTDLTAKLGDFARALAVILGTRWNAAGDLGTDIAAIITSAGAKDDAATADDLSDITTTSLNAKVRRLLLRFSADAFAATIAGSSKTDVEGMLGALATYFKAAGAAFSATVTGVAQTDLETALTALASYFNAASAALNVTIDNGGSARSNLNDILNDLGAMLAGAAGITTWRAGAAPSDGVSFAEAIRYISENIGLEGATSLANKLTAARAALLDEITNARMSELDAANIPADIDTINTNQGDPSGHTLISTTTKLGDLARSIAVILGTRWDSSGDLGTDIAAIISALATIAGYLDTEIAGLVTEVAKVPKSDSNVSWNGTALQAIQDEAEDALEGENLDHLLAATDGAGNFPNTAVDGSVISKILSKVAGGDTSSYDETTDSLEALRDRIDALETARPTNAGVLQEAATTIDLNQAAATYDLFTGATQPVILESLIISMPVGAAGGAITSISIQTDHATPQIIVDGTTGAVANLTSEAQIAWAGKIRVGVGKKIQLTIAGGAHGSEYICNVNAEYRAVVNGGTLS